MNYLFDQRKSSSVSFEVVAKHWERFTEHVTRRSEELLVRDILSNFCLLSKFQTQVFLRKGVLKICSKFTGEHPCRNAISIKLLCNSIEILLRHGCSPANLLHIFRINFSKKTSGRSFLELEPGAGCIKIQRTNYWCQLKCTKTNPCLIT